VVFVTRAPRNDRITNPVAIVRGRSRSPRRRRPSSTKRAAAVRCRDDLRGVRAPGPGVL